MRILVLGGSGFVGRHLLRQLGRQGHRVTALVRRIEQHRDIRLLPNVNLVESRYLTDLILRKYIRNQDVVINLIGQSRESASASFEQTHVALLNKILSACEVEGVSRFIHLSAMNANEQAASRYLQTKGKAESLIQQSDLQATILRPSAIFGQHDHFIEPMRQAVARNRFIPVIAPQAQLMPVWVGDVVAALADCVSNPQTIGQTYDLCGERIYEIREVWQQVAEMQRKPVYLKPLSAWCSRMLTRFFSWCPKVQITADMLQAMQTPICCTQTFPWSSSRLSLRSYLAQLQLALPVRSRFAQMREVAGR